MGFNIPGLPLEIFEGNIGPMLKYFPKQCPFNLVPCSHLPLISLSTQPRVIAVLYLEF